MALNRGFDQGTTLLSGDVGAFLDSPGLGGEGFVLNRVIEPLRIIAPTQVIEPSRVIDPVGYLPKEDEILGPQVQFSLRTAKIKTSVRRKFPFCILPAVAAAVGMTLEGAQSERGGPLITMPD